MKGRKIREFLKKKKAVGCAVLAAAVVIGGVTVWQPAQEVEFPSYTDPVMEVSLEEEETPLASTPKVTTKTKKKKTTKKVKLKKASKKTYTKKLPTTTDKSTTTKTSGNKTITTEKTVVTKTTEKYTKKKKYKKVTKTVITTTKTTTVTKAEETTDDSAESVDGESISSGTSTSIASASSGSTTSSSSSSSTAKTASTTQKYEIAVTKIAPKMDSRVLSAYTTLGFKVYVDPSVTSYSGYFDAKSQSITLRAEDSTIYHELGHFLAFIANNYDRSSAFASVYSSEKGLYTGINKVYVTQSASEYFAESVRDYINDPSSLKENRPKTYAAVETALNKITDSQVAKIKKIYGAYWN